MTFEFKAKYGLLTYAQCGGLDPWAVVSHLGCLGAECIIGQEDHADGGLHLHAFFMFERQFRSRNVRVFDVGGCHPNVVRGYGTPEKGWDYATKDGNVVAGGLERPSGNRISDDGSAWAVLVAIEDREEFFEACKTLAPRALLCNFSSLRAYSDWRFRTELAPYESPRGLEFDTSQYGQLDAWVQQALGRSGHPGKCLVIHLLNYPGQKLTRGPAAPLTQC